MFRNGIEFVRQNDLPTVWNALIRRDAHPVLQFFKYGVCGILSVVSYYASFAALGYTILPAFQEVGGEAIPIATRRPNFIIVSVIAFLVSNAVAYFSNILWVFTAGRHHPFLEFFYFTAISSIGFVVGMLTALSQMRSESSSSWIASVILIVTSALVNFLCRKFFVFKH